MEILAIFCIIFGFLGICYYLFKADQRSEDIRRMKDGYRDSSKNPFNKDEDVSPSY
jgi:hypothetical protein